MVGFYSTEHRGVFTPGTSDAHVHSVTTDWLAGGHVETFTLAPGARLLVPARAR
jgi:acetolactate decarboxylase